MRNAVAPRAPQVAEIKTPASETRVKASKRQTSEIFEIDGRELSTSLADALEAILRSESA